jgi:predicted SnoaL-like aldol condensation-catalyzing enzyme
MSAAEEPPTRKQRYEETIRRFRGAVLFTQDYDAIREILTEDFVDHFAPPWDPPGREGVEYRFAQAATALKTERIEILTSICEGDVLSQAILIHFQHTGEFLGIGPTGQRFAIGGSNTFHFRGDRIAEHWGVFDVAKIPDLLGAGLSYQGSWSTIWES